MIEKTNLTIPDLSEDNKPREKLLKNGKKSLSDAELIAIIIGSGQQGQNAIQLAQQMLKDYEHSLSRLSRAEATELIRNYKGIEKAKAAKIIAALELGYRLGSNIDNDKSIYAKNSMDLYKYVSGKIIDQPYEEFWAIYLNVRNKIISSQQISSGGITDTPVDLRHLFKYALEHNAVRIAVAHNHPTGDTKPSSMDNKLTYKLHEAGKLMNIELIDHIIVGIDGSGQQTYYSYHDNGNIL
ncbi:MAG: DNA repair protein RadC [Bacteroidales bacterium]|nr:DNA repair protein RadC [Bacteroidales bacterium]